MTKKVVRDNLTRDLAPRKGCKLARSSALAPPSPSAKGPTMGEKRQHTVSTSPYAGLPGLLPTGPNENLVVLPATERTVKEAAEGYCSRLLTAGGSHQGPGAEEATDMAAGSQRDCRVQVE